MNRYTRQVINTLRTLGYESKPVPTGGGCEAVEVTFPDGSYLLVTNGDAGLPDGEDLWIGRYTADGSNADDGVISPHDMTEFARIVRDYLNN